MGIQGLIGLVEKASTSVNITQLSGSVCVIDAFGWLHKAGYGCAEQLYNGQHTEQYVSYCLKKTQMLIDAGIKPIVVFDGQRLPAKELTHRLRQSMRHNTRQKIELLLADGKESKAKELMRSCVEVTPEMARNLMRGLRRKDIDFIVAPFEADAQMAYLVNNGFADFVITEDSDLLVYNCRLCLFKLDSTGNGKLVDMSQIKLCLGNNFDISKFRHMSILSGCDYLPNLPGIGLQRAKKFFKLTANTDLKTVLYKVPNYLNMGKKVKVTEEYVNNFIRADNTFKYQIVFCPKRRQLVPLTPYEKCIEAEELKYAGTHFDDTLGEDFAFQYAIGNVDTKTLKTVDSYCFEAESDSIWSENWFSYKKSFTKNSIILQKSGPNKVLSVSEDNYCQKREFSQTETQTIKQRKHTELENKRFKADENRLIKSSQLFEEYSSPVVSDTQRLNVRTLRSHTSQNQTYSRNVFKVNTDFVEEKTFQSKYFTKIQLESTSREESVLNTNDRKPLNGRIVQNSPELSQISLNSSGMTDMTEVDSTFDETLTLSDTERSEISETSDEEIIASNSFTTFKQQINGSVKQLAPFNSSFTNSAKNSDIRTYFNFK